MGDNEGSRPSTTPERQVSAAEVLKVQIYNALTFKNLSFDQYRFLLFITFLVNLVFFSLQVGRFGYLIEHHDLKNDNALALVILAFLLTSINMAHLIRLMRAPTPRVAVSCMGIICVQQCIFLAETAAYYDDIVEGYTYILVLSIFFLFLQQISVVVVYRFWELILFNFDSESWAGGTPSTGNLSDINVDGSFAVGNRHSTGGIHPSKAKSPIHIENRNSGDVGMNSKV